MQARTDAITLVQKQAVFENQLTAEAKITKLQLCYLGQSNLVNLTLSLKISNLQRHMLANTQLFYMDPNTRVCQFLGVYPFNDDVFVEIDHKHKEKVHFRFKKVGGPTASTRISPPTKQPVNPKSRERTIGEVWQHLEARNQLYRNPSTNYTLQQAADIIDLPKKTLDDYDRHMRMAEAYGFDFQKNRNQGMGMLRAFVKEQNAKQKSDPPTKQEFIDPGYFLSIGPGAGKS